MTSTREVLARKTRVRAGHRASTTRLITQAETALIADLVNPVDLELLVANLGRKLGDLAPLDENISSLPAKQSFLTLHYLILTLRCNISVYFSVHSVNFD